jgi:hypothetical protein
MSADRTHDPDIFDFIGWVLILAICIVEIILLKKG